MSRRLGATDSVAPTVLGAAGRPGAVGAAGHTGDAALATTVEASRCGWRRYRFLGFTTIFLLTTTAFFIQSGLTLNDDFKVKMCRVPVVAGIFVEICCRHNAFERAKHLAVVEDQQAAQALAAQPAQVPAERASVAVVFIGQLRALHADVVLKKIEEELIQPLEPDIFLVTSTNNSFVAELQGASRGGAFQILSTEEILKRLKPVDVHFYSGLEYVTAYRSRSCKSWRQIYAQFWPFPFAINLILQAEQRKSRRYDWIIRSRPDVTFLGRPLHLPSWSERAMVYGQEHYHGCSMCDHFFLATRSALEAVFTVEDSFRRCEDVLRGQDSTSCWCCNNQCHRRVKCGSGRLMGGYDTECTVKRHLLQRNVVINTSRTFLVQTHRLKLVEANWFSSRHVTLEPGLRCPWE